LKKRLLILILNLNFIHNMVSLWILYTTIFTFFYLFSISTTCQFLVRFYYFFISAFMQTILISIEFKQFYFYVEHCKFFMSTTSVLYSFFFWDLLKLSGWLAVLNLKKLNLNLQPVRFVSGHPVYDISKNK